MRSLRWLVLVLVVLTAACGGAVSPTKAGTADPDTKPPGSTSNVGIRSTALAPDGSLRIERRLP